MINRRKGGAVRPWLRGQGLGADREVLTSLISNEHISSQGAQVTASKVYTIKDMCDENRKVKAKIERAKEMCYGFLS